MTRQAAVRAVAAIRPGDTETLAWLCERATHDEAAIVRRAAVAAVGSGWAGVPEALEFLRDRAAHDEHAFVREAAGRMLGYLSFPRPDRSGGQAPRQC
jgi:HEAT repeat protein